MLETFLWEMIASDYFCIAARSCRQPPVPQRSTLDLVSGEAAQLAVMFVKPCRIKWRVLCDIDWVHGFMLLMPKTVQFWSIWVHWSLKTWCALVQWLKPSEYLWVWVLDGYPPFVAKLGWITIWKLPTFVPACSASNIQPDCLPNRFNIKHGHS